MPMSPGSSRRQSLAEQSDLVDDPFAGETPTAEEVLSPRTPVHVDEDGVCGY